MLMITIQGNAIYQCNDTEISICHPDILHSWRAQVGEDFLLNEMLRNKLTRLESVNTKASVKVTISDSRVTVQTPHSSIAVSMIKNIVQQKWQHVVNTTDLTRLNHLGIYVTPGDCEETKPNGRKV